jgi:hypothetical protein
MMISTTAWMPSHYCRRRMRGGRPGYFAGPCPIGRDIDGPERVVRWFRMP